MREILKIWWRAFSIVTCTALNVVQVSNHNFVAAFFTGGLLSFVWWANTKTAAHNTGPYAQYAYAFGAACGTINGMALGILFSGR
jgi:hypothetical protein